MIKDQKELAQMKKIHYRSKITNLDEKEPSQRKKKKLRSQEIIVKFLYKNGHIFLQRPTILLTKIVTISRKWKIIFQKLSKFQSFMKKLLNFSEKSSNFPAKAGKFFCKIRPIFLQRSSSFPAKIVKCTSKNRQIFLQNSSNFLAKIVTFSCKKF